MKNLLKIKSRYMLKNKRLIRLVGIIVLLLCFLGFKSKIREKHGDDLVFVSPNNSEENSENIREDSEKSDAQLIEAQKWTKIIFPGELGNRTFHYETRTITKVDFINQAGDTLSKVSPENFLNQNDTYLWIWSEKTTNFIFTFI